MGQGLLQGLKPKPWWQDNRVPGNDSGFEAFAHAVEGPMAHHLVKSLADPRPVDQDVDILLFTLPLMLAAIDAIELKMLLFDPIILLWECVCCLDGLLAVAIPFTM
jgi:hypothetical protein